MRRFAVIGVWVALAGASPVHADETFDVSTYEKKAFEWTGFLESRAERQWLRQDSTGYLLAVP